MDWLRPGDGEHPVLILLEIINWSIGVIMFIFFICKASNRALLAEMLPSSSVDDDAVTLRMSLSLRGASRPGALCFRPCR